MPQSFFTEHRARLVEFQSGEERFVWGQVKVSDNLWFLEEDTAHEHREYVKGSVVCPVPGCAAPLTTVHNAKKRDHLRHLAGTGGHASESIFHSQGCALIETWLRATYPRSTVRREEYTDETGERRADVLLTGKRGDRVAFEVQYSPLTPDSWRRRHESYRSQGIVDVWLFGHVGKQLRLHRNGYLEPNPTHLVVVESGAALLFINPDPERQQIALAAGTDRKFDAALDTFDGDRISVLYNLDHAQLAVYPLADFRADLERGFTSDVLDELYARSHWLRSHNKTARALVLEIRERRKREWAERQQRWELRRAPQQARIRELFTRVDRWSKSDALDAIKVYFGEHLKGRIRRNPTPNAAPDLLERWQCVIYFDLIAGQQTPFGTREAYRALQRRGVRMDEKTAFRDIARYLYELCEEDFLRQQPGYGKYPSFQPTISGAWW